MIRSSGIFYHRIMSYNNNERCTYYFIAIIIIIIIYFTAFPSINKPKREIGNGAELESRTHGTRVVSWSQEALSPVKSSGNNYVLSYKYRSFQAKMSV